ncbi:aldehyde dehydrogenase family protein [Tsukamurella serpentis]
MPARIRSLVDGRWVDGGGPDLVSVSPAQPDCVVAQGRSASAVDVSAAVAAARRAAPEWATTPLHARAEILTRAAAIIESNADTWGADLSHEEGKTLAEGIGEVQRAAQVLRYQAGAADREQGRIFSSPRRGEQILTTRRPVGVVAVLTPFNFPIAIPAWKIAPALVHGNTVVFKPADTVPLLAMRLASALLEAGVPDGVLNLVQGGAEVGAHLIGDSSVDAVTFTGSTAAGRSIAASCAARGVPVQAEMGGKNPAVVLADADLGHAAEQILLGAFRSTGQKCTATSRLVVVDTVADDLLKAIVDGAAAQVVGDPLDPTVTMGPVITAAARDRVLAAVDTAIADGARLLSEPTGGDEGAGTGPTPGYFVPPTVLEVDPAAPPSIWFDELFGPVLAVARVGSTEEAFELAGAGEFGLSASVFTDDLDRALTALERVDVGILHVNSESAGADPHVPFGGAKASSYGPGEQGEAAREFFTRTTTAYVRSSRSSR